MQYVYDLNSGNQTLTVTDDNYRYLFKARRHKIDDEIFFRNLNDDFLYKYIVKDINKKDATLILQSNESKVVASSKKLHIAWCVIDTKTVEKYLPSLNEIGVDKITFVYSDYSQKNFKPNLEKLNKILINSSQQCGRSNLMKLEVCSKLSDFLSSNPNTKILDFSENCISNSSEIDTILIGTEGGFSQNEREFFNKDNIIGFDCNLILRSETATLGVASKILL